MTIRVAFNATPLLSPLAGVGQYIVELSAALVATGDIDPYSFYLHRWRHEAPRPPAKLSGVPVSLVQRIKPWLPFRGGLRIANWRCDVVNQVVIHLISIPGDQNTPRLRTYRIPRLGEV